MLHDADNDRLIAIYKKWGDEFRGKCPSLLTQEYSNPYYISIPHNWSGSAKRIMIVGEEGNGVWGCGKGDGWAFDDFTRIQAFNRSYVDSQLHLSKAHQYNRSSFWVRFRKIAHLGNPCIWNNQDKIHLRKDRSCSLGIKDRRLLHSTNTKLLHEEIALLKPTVVVFFGWRRLAIRAELPYIDALAYPNDEIDSELDKSKLLSVEYDGVTYIFTYHPAWRKKPNGYEERVLQAVEAALLK